MNKNLIFILFFTLPFISKGQIDCKPTLGFGFKPIEKGISLYVKPDLNSAIAFKSPSRDGIWLSCTSTNVVNDFVEVKAEFIHNAFIENGVNPLLLDLYSYLTDEYNYDFNFQEYTKYIMVEKNQKDIYNLLYNDNENDWFKDYSSREDYDMSTFEGFYNNWISYDKENSNDNYIFENQNTIVYVQKSDITNEGTVSLILNGGTSDYYLKFLNEQIDYKNSKSCIYTEDKLLTYFEYYCNALIKEESPFKVIKEINEFSNHFKEFKSRVSLDFLKMKASYFDGNYSTTIELSKKLIDLFDNKKITNSKNSFNGGDIDMSMVYAFTISSLLQTEKYTDALKYSQKCDTDNSLKFEQHNQFYAIALLNLERKNEACSILNKAYLNGDEGARELIKKHCE
ncbi:MAG: hypothetical protein GYB35_16040 [Algicola sp.]|nr:hypothetical protein [Algicola sp.]